MINILSKYYNIFDNKINIRYTNDNLFNNNNKMSSGGEGDVTKSPTSHATGNSWDISPESNEAFISIFNQNKVPFSFDFWISLIFFFLRSNIEEEQ